MKKLINIILGTLLCIPLQAQSNKEKGDSISIIMKQYKDSLTAYEQKADSLLTTGTTFFHPEQYRMLMPFTYYGDIAHDALSLYQRLTPTQKAMLRYYLSRPDLVGTTEKELSAMVTPQTDGNTLKKQTEATLTEAAGAAAIEPAIENVTVVVKKPKFWTLKSEFFLHFLQNYVSANWYKGGESSYSMVSSLTLQANYNNKQKVKWDNMLELKLGYQTTKGDTVHKFKTSEDLIRYTGKLGLQATKRWYYTLQVLAWTQFTKGYKSNDRFIYSDFMSPFNLNISLGMDYNLEWFKKRLTGSVHLAPLAYNFRYVGRDALAPRYGIKDGRHTLNDFGSQFTVNLQWKFTDNLSWKTRIYGYTTYSRFEFEWENTFNFQFNKYISTQVFLYPRFDDAARRVENHSYWQFKEYASVGFNYSC